jgi:hypothetical protein
LRVHGLAGRLVAMLEVPLELADRRRVKRRLQLLVDHSLIGVVDPFERTWKHDPQRPPRRDS